jgi:hypothetical protein
VGFKQTGTAEGTVGVIKQNLPDILIANYKVMNMNLSLFFENHQQLSNLVF